MSVAGSFAEDYLGVMTFLSTAIALLVSIYAIKLSSTAFLETTGIYRKFQRHQITELQLRICLGNHSNYLNLKTAADILEQYQHPLADAAHERFGQLTEQHNYWFETCEEIGNEITGTVFLEEESGAIASKVNYVPRLSFHFSSSEQTGTQ